MRSAATTASNDRRPPCAAWFGLGAALLGGALLLGGCTPDASGGLFIDRDVAGAAHVDVAGGQPLDANGSGGLSGQWAMVAEWSTCVTVGSEFETRAWRLLKVKAEHTQNRFRETRTLCQLRLSPILGLATVVPQPLIDGHPVMVVDSLMLGGEAAGAVYLGGFEVQRFGIELVDLLGETMPAKSATDDPRIIDAENDGKPGATFHVGSSCDVHVAQREVSALSGVLGADGRIEGGGVHTIEQVVFSSSKAICGQPFSTRPNDAHNRLVMVRSEAFDDDGDGDVSCAGLGAHGDAIWKMSEADDTRCATK